MLVALLGLFLLGAPTNAQETNNNAPNTTQQASDKEWFQKTEQALMDALATGDKAVWDRILDENFVYTTEEGQVLSKHELLKELSGLPPGLSGSIKVEDLTVQQFPTFAVVRFRGDETEDVFGQVLRTKYRTTDTYMRLGAEWKLLASHVSVVTTDPAPQEVSKDGWPQLAGKYKLMPNGWDFYVVLKDGSLSAGRDPNKVRPLIPLAPNVFVRKGALAELIFVTDKTGKATKIVDYRKFQPLIWTRTGN